MKLSDKAIKNLQKIIKNDYCQTINEEEANELGTSLLRLTKLALNNWLKNGNGANKQKPQGLSHLSHFEKPAGDPSARDSSQEKC